MIVAVPRETDPGETRAALTPETARRMAALGLEVRAEAGVGALSYYPDDDYAKAGVRLTGDRAGLLKDADIVLRVRRSEPDDLACIKRGAWHMSFLDPFRDPDGCRALAAAGLTAVSLEMMPRTTLAQKMDALSSQASLAGYVAVVESAARLGRLLPMMMTPAGTLAPARYFIVGVGVAGLQAIATAKRLGARVEAFDTRPVVEEQVRSLGAKFVKIDLGDTGQTAQGYAQELTPDQIRRQQEGMARVCAQSDVIITTAKVFGRPAPRLITRAMLEAMKPGALVVDLAAETGGNVEGSVPGREVTTDAGVRILGAQLFEGRVPHHATQVLASNLAAFVEHFWDKAGATLRFDPADEIQKACVLARDGKILQERFA